MIETCFFDLDGTLLDHHGKLYEGLSGALGPDSPDFSMTFLTGKRYSMFDQTLTENPGLAVTPGMPVALENGGRVLDLETGENITYHPLSVDEREAIYCYINEAGPLRYVAFQGREARAKARLWVPDYDLAVKLSIDYARNADVFTGDLQELFEAIETDEPCMVTCRTNGEAPTDAPPGMRVYMHKNSAVFISSETDKGTAAQTIADVTGIDLSETLAAGNDANDLPVLTLDGLGLPVAVGKEIPAEMRAALPDHTLYVPDPCKFGTVLIEQASRT